VPLDSLRRYAPRAVAAALVVVGLWVVIRGIEVRELLGALARTNGSFIVATSVSLLAVGSVLRTGRYRALLPPTRWLDIWSAIVLSGAANNVLPLRAGELVRTRETVGAGVPLRRVVSAQIAEKIVEAGTLVLWATPAVASYAGLRSPMTTVGVVLGLGAAVVTWAARRYGEIGMTRLASAAAWALVADALEIAVVAACLRGVGAPAGLVPSVAVFAAVNVAISVPSTPGNLGAQEAGAALPLMALGVEQDTAVAFALIYRAVQWLPITVAGAALLALRPRVRAS
jgi:uncharacterized membrane protein YbhN (UPF0104 family)